ncbi:methyl-accepting chemotaxis protein [Solidesulfovibrio magneticus]|nr:methyl-accepting chemotaxis protein [Solidesulfovibrio magneticus]
MGVRSKLYLLLGVCVLGFACLFAADQVGSHYTERYQNLEELAANAYVEVLQVRREEKNFLLRHDPSTVSAVSQHIGKVRANVEDILRRDNTLAGEAGQALAELTAYGKSFDELAAIEKAKGFTEHEGIMRDFVYAARDLDDKFAPIADKDFQILLLTIRRHEKNWQLRDETSYVVKVQDGVKKLHAMVAAAEDLSAAQKKGFDAVIDAYQRSFMAYVDASAKAKQVTAAMVESGRKLMPPFEKIEKHYADKRHETDDIVDRAQVAVEVGLAVVVLLVILWIVRGISNSLAALGAYSRKVASGDLEAKPAGRFEAEFAALRDDTTAMVDNLKVQMRQVEEKQAEAARSAQAAEEAMREAMRKEEELAKTLSCMKTVAEQAADISRRLSGAAQELSSQTEQSAAGVELQRRRVDETASAVTQMNSTILEIAANAGQAAKNAETTRDNAVAGAEVVKQAGESMTAVNGIAVALKGDMGHLGQEAQSIGEVVGVINDIADQTNLLALNAAIEAARAGDAGRGFAVVADEVRKLAEKTMVATKEVESRIRAIQEAAGRNIRGMDEAVAAVTEANALAGRSGQAILAIVGNADATSGAVQSIAASAEEQSAASEQISRAITEISGVAEDNVAGVEATSRAAHALAAMAEELGRLIVTLGGDACGGPAALPEARSGVKALPGARSGKKALPS